MRLIEEIFDLLDQNDSDSGDVDSVLSHIAHVTYTFLDADLCVGIGVNPFNSSRPPRVALAGGLDGAVLDARQVLANLRPIIAPEPDGQVQPAFVPLSTADLPPDLFPTAEGYRYIAIVLPAPRSKQLLAIVVAHVASTHTYTPSEDRRIRLFARQAAETLYDAWNIYRYQEVLRIGREINQELTDARTLFHCLATDTADILDTSYALLLAVFKPQRWRFDYYFTEQGRIHERRNAPFEGGSRFVIEQQTALTIHHLSVERENLSVDLIELSETATIEESLIFVPLILRENVYGVLSVQHPKPYHYDSKSLLILQLLGNHAALALNNIFLYKGLRRLSQTGELLTRELTSAHVLTVAVEAVLRETRADLVILYPYEQGQRQFIREPCYAGMLHQPNIPLPNATHPDDIASHVVNQANSIFATDSLQVYQLLGEDYRGKRGTFVQREGIVSTAALPLRVGAEPVGVLFVNFRYQQRFDAAQKLLIEGLGRYASIAIKNARIFHDVVQRRTNELGLISRIDQVISRTLHNLPEALQGALTLLKDRLNADAAAILQLNPSRRLLDPVVTIGVAPDSPLLPISLEGDKDIAASAMRNRQSIRVTNVQEHPFWHSRFIPLLPDLMAQIAVPLLDDDKPIGVLTLISRREGMFSEEDEKFLLAVSGLVVQAIKNAQAYQRERRLANESQALVEIGKKIATQLEADGAFKLILQQALHLTHSAAGNLMLYDSRREDLWMAAGRGQNVDQATWRQRLGEGVVGVVATTRKLVNIDVRQPPWAQLYRAAIPDMCYELAVPLLEGEQLRGVINIERGGADAPFDESDEHILEAFADLVIVAIQNTERYQAAATGRSRLEALHKIDKEIIRQMGDTDQVMRVVLTLSLQLTTAERADLDLYKQARVATTYFARHSTTESTIILERVDADDVRANQIQRGIIAHVAQTRKAYYTLGDAQDDPHYIGEGDIHSEVAVPLLDDDGTLIGVLNLESSQPFAFGPDDAYVLELFAGQAVIAIQNAQNFTKAAQELRRFQVLHRAGHELANVSSLRQVDEAYSIVVSLAHEHSRSQVVIRRQDPQDHSLVVVRSVPEHPIVPIPRLAAYQGVTGMVMQTGETQVVHDTATWDHVEVMRSTPPEASLVVTPILLNDRLYGTLTLMHEQPFAFIDTDVALFKGLAQQLALTLNRLEITQERLEAEIRAVENDQLSLVGQLAGELLHKLVNEAGPNRLGISRIERELHTLGIDSPLIAQELKRLQEDRARASEILSMLRENQQEARALLIKSQNPRKFSVAALLEDMVKSYPYEAAKVTVIAESPPYQVIIYANDQQIRDLLRNLFTNAVQALPHGGRITLRAYVEEPMAVIEVEDTGQGIPAMDHERIFEPNFSTKPKGTGFGLFSARRYARMNRGQLTVRSQVGVGSTFVLKLPLAKE